ncbi:hypothetical protein ACVWVY_005600 [Bradyrhizobium sp. URHC0002]
MTSFGPSSRANAFVNAASADFDAAYTPRTAIGEIASDGDNATALGKVGEGCLACNDWPAHVDVQQQA